MSPLWGFTVFYCHSIIMTSLRDYPKTDENNKFHRNEMIIELSMGTITEKRGVTNVAP